MVLTRYLLIVVFRCSSGLRQNVDAFGIRRLPCDLVVEYGTRIACDHFIGRRFICVVSVIFQRVSSNRGLRSVNVRVVKITNGRLVRTVLLRDVVNATVKGRDHCFLTQRDTKRDSLVCRQGAYCHFFRDFRFHVRSLNVPEGFSRRYLVNLGSRELTTRGARLYGSGRYTTRRCR